MPKTNKKKATHNRNKSRKVDKKKSQPRGLQSNRPPDFSIAPTIPEYIAPTGFVASIGRFLGSLGKPKR